MAKKRSFREDYNRGTRSRTEGIYHTAPLPMWFVASCFIVFIILIWAIAEGY